MWFPELIAYSVGLAKILSVSELKAVLAHELGHIVLRRTLFAWLRVFALTALRLVSALGDRTVAALVLLSIVVFILGSKEDSLLGYTVWVLSFAFLAEYLFLIVTIPFSLWCSRKNEHAADAFAAHATDAGTLARALRKMLTGKNRQRGRRKKSRSLVRMLVHSFLSTHPPTAERLRRLRRIRDEKRREERARSAGCGTRCFVYKRS